MSERSVEALVSEARLEVQKLYLRLHDYEATACLATICLAFDELAKAVQELNEWHCGGCGGGKAMHLCEKCKQSLRGKKQASLEKPEAVQWTGGVQAIHDFGVGYSVTGTKLFIQTNLPGSAGSVDVGLGDWITRTRKKDDTGYTFWVVRQNRWDMTFAPEMEQV